MWASQYHAQGHFFACYLLTSLDPRYKVRAPPTASEGLIHKKSRYVHVFTP